MTPPDSSLPAAPDFPTEADALFDPPGLPGVHILGIRHHGPGSARSVVQALAQIRPSVVLIEGPPEANDLLPLAASGTMVPPVAILVYRPDRPADAVYYPFATFSPEWQAIRHALAHDVPVRFIDLPVSHFLADRAGKESSPSPARASAPRLVDPLGLLAQAAGFDDGERWWDFVVESRRHAAESGGVGLFRAICRAMAEVRQSQPEADDPRELQREAHMRRAIRAAQAEGHARIAVVCGAWHAPVLDPDGWLPARLDAAYLKGLPKVKVTATWVPWTMGRLARASGYGAGIEAPGWYDHLWTYPEAVAERWLTRAARLLRGERLDASSALVIEAVRLAEALATIRGRPLVDLADLDEATRSVLCHGEDAPMRLIDRQLKVADRLGQVPEETPSVALRQDLARLQRSLRLSPEVTTTVKVLDLRNSTDLARSHLLHRLRLLKVHWGHPVETSGRGTFKEGWELAWLPELSVALIEASVWGSTVVDAAVAWVTDRAGRSTKLADLTALLDQVILADLPTCLAEVMAHVEASAAVATEVTDLLAALPALAHLSRYGSVRRTEAASLALVASRMMTRIAIGLPPAGRGLSEEAALPLFQLILRAHAAVTLMDRPDDRAAWLGALGQLATDEAVPGLLAGRAARIRADSGADESSGTAQLLSLALSPAVDPARASGWLEGFLRESGEVLVHDEALFGLLDGWISGLPPEAFQAVLPLVRATFSTFGGPLRRTLGELAAQREALTPGADPRTKRTQSGVENPIDPDPDRAAAALPILQILLGLNGANSPAEVPR